MNKGSVLLKRGTLLDALVSTTERAIRKGALFPIPTEYDFIEDGGIRFFIRTLTSLARKDEERKRQEQREKSGVAADPFLPYEKDLFVADVSETHVALLNKFNVVDRHLLIVTREFEDQENLLNSADFEALWACLTEYPGLGFYNGGAEGGASQAHKHLQAVPLPLAPEGPEVPIEPLLRPAECEEVPCIIDSLPFLHSFSRISVEGEGISDMAAKTFDLYCAMLKQAGMKAPCGDRPERQAGPYCLLVTREWMLLVPRSAEFFEGISINSLGFAGALLVRDEGQMATLRRRGPMTALKSVSLPRRT